MAVVPTNAMDVEPSIRDEIIRFFERNKIEYGFGAYYNIDLLLTQYISVLHKSVLPQPRKVFISRELNAKLNTISFAQWRPCLMTMKSEFERGVDMRFRLSTGSAKAYSKDNLLIAWKIHHFHFNPALKQGDMLLFAIVNDDAVYMVDVLPHNHYSFSTYRLLEIAVSNWRFLYDRYEVKADHTTIVIRSEKDIDKLWKGNINTAFAVQNKVYMPGLFTGNGQDGDAAIRTNTILNTIKVNQIKGILNDCTLKQVWLTGRTTPTLIIDYWDRNKVLHTWPL